MNNFQYKKNKNNVIDDKINPKIKYKDYNKLENIQYNKWKYKNKNCDNPNPNPNSNINNNKYLKNNVVNINNVLNSKWIKNICIAEQSYNIEKILLNPKIIFNNEEKKLNSIIKLYLFIIYKNFVKIL